MKISILINPQSTNSTAIQHAYDFIQASIKKKHTVTQVFFYGEAVGYVFSQNPSTQQWQTMSDKGLKLLACSTLAKEYQRQKLNRGFELAGLGQWIDSVLSTDKHIEFS